MHLPDEDTPDGRPAPLWREQAVSRRLVSARARAEERVQRFLDAAVSLMQDKRSTEFTIQEVVERSGQSLRSFYQYFDGKDELLFALFEEAVRESEADLDTVIAGESDPFERLKSFAIRLSDWFGPTEDREQRGTYNLIPIAEFSWNLAMKDPGRVGTVMEPLGRTLLGLLEDAKAAGAISVENPQRSAVLMLQTIIHGWLIARAVDDPRLRSSAEETWAFCLNGLRG